MSYFMSVVLGLVQGIAEFLPISSSGHLSILQNIFGVDNPEQGHLFFDILLHLGTLISVCVFYRREIAEMILEFFGLIADVFKGKGAGVKKHAARRLIVLIIIGTLPLFAIVKLNDYVEQLYYNTFFIGIALIATGTMLYISGKVKIGNKDEKNAKITDVLFIGCAQAVAVIPGLSRSGFTITASLLRGCSSSFAVRFSFLLSIPAILGANVLNLFEAAGEGVDSSLYPVYIVGMIVAAISGYFAIVLVKKLTEGGGLKRFSWYCWTVGAAAIIVGIVL